MLKSLILNSLYEKPNWTSKWICNRDGLDNNNSNLNFIKNPGTLYKGIERDRQVDKQDKKPAAKGRGEQVGF